MIARQQTLLTLAKNKLSTFARVSIFIMCSSFTIDARNITTFLPRSQGANTARELVGWQTQLYLPYDVNYAALAMAIEYTRSRETENIASKLLTTTCLRFEGSQVPNRDNTDRNAIVADYFGLPTDFQGTLSIKPRIENVIIDLNYYFGLNEWLYGLYFKIHTPITHTRWTLGLDTCEPCRGKFRGCTRFPDCYMFSRQPRGEDLPCPTVPFPNVSLQSPTCPVNPTLNPPEFLKNTDCTTQCIRDALSGTFLFGDIVEPWNYGRFDFCPRSKTGLADIDFILGWNPLETNYAHCGFYTLCVIPTGNRPKAKYIFEPLVGNGRHWELGVGFSAHASLYENTPYSNCNVGFYIDGNLTHMFSTDQVRSFDFKANGPLSRYILLKEYNIDDTYAQRMINAINFATRNCDVSVKLKADVSAKLFFVSNGWQIDAGYNFYYKDKECIKIETDCPCNIDSRRFAIKGLEGVCSVNYEIMSETNDLVLIIGNENPPHVPLSADQPHATMFSAVLPASAPVTAPQPGHAATIGFGWNGNSEIISSDTDLATALAEGFIVANTADKPYIVSCADLDPRSAAQGKMITHKFFGHIGFTFENSCYSPHIGIGAEIEFDGHKHNALSQWGAWIKGGLSF